MKAKIPAWDETDSIPSWDETEESASIANPGNTKPEVSSARDQVTFLGSEKLGKLAADMFPRVAQGAVDGRGYGAQVGGAGLDLLSLPGRGIASSGAAPDGAKWSDGNPSLGDIKGKSLGGRIIRDPAMGAAALAAPFTGGISLGGVGGIALRNGLTGLASVGAHQGENMLNGEGFKPGQAAAEEALNIAIPVGGSKLAGPIKGAGVKIYNSVLKPGAAAIKAGFAPSKSEVLKGTEALLETGRTGGSFTDANQAVNDRIEALADQIEEMITQKSRHQTVTTKAEAFGSSEGKTAVDVTGGTIPEPGPANGLPMGSGPLQIPQSTAIPMGAPRPRAAPPDVAITPNPNPMAARIDPRFVKPTATSTPNTQDVYYHGSSSGTPGSNAGMLQLSKDPEIAKMYAGKSGKAFRVSQNENTKVMDLTDHSEISKIAKDIEDDYAAGRLGDYGYEMEDALGKSELGKEDFLKMAKGFSPQEIVNSAENWDNQSAVNWFVNKYDHAMVKTGNGGIVLDPSKVSLSGLGLPSPIPDAPQGSAYGIPGDNNLPTVTRGAGPLSVQPSGGPLVAPRIGQAARSPGAAPSAQGPLGLPPGASENTIDVTKRINLMNALNRTRTGMGSELAAGEHAGLADDVAAGQNQWHGDLEARGFDGPVSPKQALTYQRGVGAMGKFNYGQNPLQIPPKARVANELYGEIGNDLEAVAPEIGPLRKEISTLIPQRMALTDAAARTDKNFAVGLREAIAAAGALHGMATTGPAGALPGLGLAGAIRASSSPRIGTAMFNAGKSLAQPSDLRDAIKRMILETIYGPEGNQSP